MTFEFQPLTQLAVAVATGGGSATPFETITQAPENQLSTVGLTRIVAGIDLLIAAGGTTRPSICLDVTDEPDNDFAWVEAWSSVASGTPTAASSYIVTLMAAIPPGQAFHLGKALRWRAVFPAPSGTTSRLVVRILLSVV